MFERYADDLRRDESLANHTTLGIGGPADFFLPISNASLLPGIIEEVATSKLPVTILGEGSNVLVADAGVRGLVLQLQTQAIHFRPVEDGVFVDVAAGVVWDDLVAESVARDCAGIECLSGIPGYVGAAPVQNIGAYGQELSQTLVEVQAIDRTSGTPVRIDAAACGFGYRTSNFKTVWKDRFLITALRLHLKIIGPGPIMYGELRQALANRDATLTAVRETVLELRKKKSMVLDETDPNTKSVGSFFTNPVVDLAKLDAAKAAGYEGPTFDTVGGMKLSAAWLIEAAGFKKGYQHGNVGLSSNHSLAIINRGGATAADVIALAKSVRNAVAQKFGVLLQPEPVALGFAKTLPELLD